MVSEAEARACGSVPSIVLSAMGLPPDPTSQAGRGLPTAAAPIAPVEDLRRATERRIGRSLHPESLRELVHVVLLGHRHRPSRRLVADHGLCVPSGALQLGFGLLEALGGNRADQHDGGFAAVSGTSRLDGHPLSIGPRASLRAVLGRRRALRGLLPARLHAPALCVARALAPRASLRPRSPPCTSHIVSPLVRVERDDRGCLPHTLTGRSAACRAQCVQQKIHTTQRAMVPSSVRVSAIRGLPFRSEVATPMPAGKEPTTAGGAVACRLPHLPAGATSHAPNCQIVGPANTTREPGTWVGSLDQASART